MPAAALLAFPDNLQQAENLSRLTGLPCHVIDIHRFPDGESKLTLPSVDASHWFIYTSLNQPNNKLVELLMVADSARQQGVASLSLICPYLAYMRQDMAFHPGEVVSQRVIGQYLSGLFQHVITVDPHLHRIHSLTEVMPESDAQVLTACDAMGQFLASQQMDLLLGPDEESQQWVEAIAALAGVDFAIAHKTRSSDTEVSIHMPDVDFTHKHVVMVDDMISTGHTIIETALQLQQRNAASINVLVTHALFDESMTEEFHTAGIQHVWSCDSIPHSTNAISLAETLAETVNTLAR